jgi:hypothetical protein
MVQGSSEAVACRSLASAGSATFTADPSMKARLEPRIVAASVARGCSGFSMLSHQPSRDFSRYRGLRILAASGGWSRRRQSPSPSLRSSPRIE